ncbi:MAG: hypothetical protein H0T51_13325 [Pirellulales bacterium]|nr:hypothetical protein [Pirellulales bacterium]
MIRRAASLVILWAGLSAVPSAVGITINTSYNPAGAGAVNPAFDLNAVQLAPIFNAAANFYEDVFEDFDHTLTVNFWYMDIADGTIGDHDLVSQAGGRETAANIQIDTNVGTGGAPRTYYFDPTPTNNDEFDMAQTLWRDASGTQRTDWFNVSVGSTVPDTFEIGFSGPANTPAAQAGFDMFSLVLHELGHALGLSGANTSTQNETMDGDYDFNPNFLFGQGLAADTVDQASDFIGHLDASTALMFPSLGGSSQRRLPSHTDLLAMAASHIYDEVDMPRREFYGGGDWNDDSNWSGARPPDFNDDAFVRASQGAGVNLTASLSNVGVAQNLTVAEGANVDTNGFRLDVGNDVTVTGIDSDVLINAGGELEADEIFIQDQAEIQMDGGTLDARRLTIDAGAQLEGVAGGAMTVDIAERLVNNGVIDVDGGAVMTFQSAAASAWDLDGLSGDGQLFANGGSLIFDTGGVVDAFDGEMTVDGGFFLRIDAPWTFSPGAVLDMNGGSGAGQSARIVGGAVTINGGTIDVDDVGGDGLTDGIAEFDGPVEIRAGAFSVGADDRLDFDNTTTVQNGVFTLAQNATISFDGVTTVDTADFTFAGDGQVVFNGPTTHSFNTVINSNGLVRQNGDAVIIGSMTVDGGVFDLDGTAGTTTIALGNVSNNGSMTLNVDQLDTINNVFDGTIETAEAGIVGRLTVNLTDPDDAWTMNGTLNLSGSGPLFQPVRVAGSDMIVSGTVNVANNSVAISADTTFNAASTINTAGGNSELIMRGATVVAAGADFNGLGTLVNDASGEMILLDGLDTAFVDLDNEGVLRLGASPGQVEVNGFMQTSSGVWEVEIGGAVASQFDSLAVDSTAELDGTITLSLLGGYVPEVGVTFDILTAPFGVSGVFDTILGGVDGATRIGVLYHPTLVQLLATFSADFDLDLDVDGDDLALWQGAYGATGVGDANGDGDSDGADFMAWQQQLGSVAAMAAATIAEVGVPEPTAWTLAWGCVMASLAVRRRGVWSIDL